MDLKIGYLVYNCHFEHFLDFFKIYGGYVHFIDKHNSLIPQKYIVSLEELKDKCSILIYFDNTDYLFKKKKYFDNKINIYYGHGMSTKMYFPIHEYFDYILTYSDFQYNFFLENGAPEQKLVKFGYLRFYNFKKNSTIEHCSHKIIYSTTKHNSYANSGLEDDDFLDQLNEFNDVHILVHPATPEKSFKRLLDFDFKIIKRQFSKFDIDTIDIKNLVEFDNKEFIDLFDSFDIIICDNSSIFFDLLILKDSKQIIRTDKIEHSLKYMIDNRLSTPSDIGFDDFFDVEQNLDLFRNLVDP